MKNWKYIEGAKTGNESIASHPDSLVAQEIYKIYLDAGKDENKALEILSTKYKSIPKEALKEHLKDAIKAYASIVRNSKTGNDTAMEYATRKPKVINEEKTGAEEFFKKLSEDVKEREEKDDEEIKLVGNETYQHKLYPDKYVIIEGNNYKIVTDGKVEKSGKITDAVLYGINQTYKRVGNFKTGTSSLKPGDRVQSYGVQGTVRKVEGENSDNIYGEPIIEVEWDNGTVKKVGEHYLRKIGNTKVKKTLFKSLATPTTWTPGINGRPISGAPEFKGTFAKDEAEKWTDKWIKDHGFEVENKTGNSASDDKFAYVMREFDAGKLKTPDGKVVTDPAQAKAIAYSESKKTENGLARARKAMNKKCGNAQITLWKGNDTVLISENGLVQYLESNSFEVDRDKYDSQEQAIEELTKKGYRKK